MTSRLLIAAAVVSLSGVELASQSPQTFEPSAELRRQVEVFEGNLRSALASAGGKLGERAREAVPQIKLWFSNEPLVEGVILPGGDGVVFIVEPSEIVPQMVAMFEMYQSLRERNLSTVSNPGVPGSRATVPPPDVVKAPLPRPLMSDPIKEYTDFVHQSLIDAMLENALALPLREGQKLTLVVGDGTLGTPKNPLDPRVRKLYLQLKAEDLIALRQNRINKDAARQRILEYRY